MRNNDTKEMNDKLFDAILQVAAEQAMKNEYDLQPTPEELNKQHPPSEALNKRMYSFIAKERRAIRRAKAVRRIAKVAAIFIVALSMCTAVLMSVEASRNFILNTFLNIQEDHIVFEFRPNEQNGNAHGLGRGYVPYGFELLSRHESDLVILTIYANEYGERLTIQQSISTTMGVAIDNEQRAFVQIIVGGQELFVFEAYEAHVQNVVMRQVGNDVFMVLSVIDVEKLLEVAVNITN